MAFQGSKGARQKQQILLERAAAGPPVRLKDVAVPAGAHVVYDVEGQPPQLCFGRCGKANSRARRLERMGGDRALGHVGPEVPGDAVHLETAGGEPLGELPSPPFGAAP